MNTLKSKIQGCLIGSAIGDGFGYPTEFMKVDEIKLKWGSQGLTAPLGKIIKVTDDTQMAISLAEGIMKSYKKDRLINNDFEEALIASFIQWLNDPENNRAPGMTCLQSCERLEKGIPWVEATAKNSKGCGANMRVIPLGLLKYKNPKITNTQIGQWAQLQSAITHAHPTALAASELTAITIVKIIEGLEPNHLVEELISHCHSQKNIYHHDLLQSVWERPGVYNPNDFINRGWEECIAILNRVKEAILLNDRITDPCEFTGEGWIAEESLATALLCFLLFPDHPEKALIRAVNTKGDSDSIACLTGGFVGAKNGIEAFPQDWVNRIEYQNELNQFISFVLNESP